MADSTSTSPSLRAARTLGDLLAGIEVNNNWSEVETNAQILANGLRNRGGPVDEHTILGKTMLPQTLTSLLKAASEGQGTLDGQHALAVFELLRVGANLCMDHNDNRGFLLDAQFPQLVASLLEGYAETLPAIPSSQPLSLPTQHLKIVKTAIGALLNLSLNYEPVQTRLISLELPSTLLHLSIAIYPPGTWKMLSSVTSEQVLEDWATRKCIAEWSWRAIASLKDNEAQQPLFDPGALPALTVPLLQFIPPHTEPSGPLYANTKTRNAYSAFDVEVLEEVCELLESLTMDVEDVRLALARGKSLNEAPPCLDYMLDFIERAEYLPEWLQSEIPREESNRWKQTVDLCKTAIIKAVVELSGEENNLETLWDISKPDGFVGRMLEWLKDAYDQPQANRDDLVICSTLSLGNLIRQEQHAIDLMKPPVSITNLLAVYLQDGIDMKVKHGVIGLLKHISQTPANRPVLGHGRILEALRTSQVFSEKSDIAEVVQMSAINLTKHMCTNNIENSVTCVTDSDDGKGSGSCLNQILALSRRSDSVPVKSEGARVLVNVIKSLCSSAGDIHDINRRQAIQIVSTAESANTLAQLLGRSRKHIILLNESIVAMLLLAHQPNGAVLVLDSLLVELPKEMAPPSRQNSLNIGGMLGSNPASPVVGPRTALDMLVDIILNVDHKFPIELRANLCSLLAELGKESLKAASGGREREVEKLRAATRPGLEAARITPDSLVLSAAAKKALELW